MNKNLTDCIVCGQKYDITKSVGTLECRFHPLPINIDFDGDRYGRFHHDCCGASDNINDILHYEMTTPKGCLAIDHSASLEEFHKIKAKPYVVLSKEDYDNNKIFIGSFSEPIFIKSSKQLTREYKLQVPFRFKPIIIDLNSIYLEHIEKNIKKERELTDGDRIGEFAINTKNLYNFNLRSIATIGDETDLINQSNFTPFVVLRRISSAQSRSKRREVASNTKSCKFNPNVHF